jgi:hypothetical protein
VSEFVYPSDPKEGFVWWKRPSYFSAGVGWDADEGPPDPGEDWDWDFFEWGCAFCDHREGTRDNYGEVGYVCPDCGAIFIGDDSFGTWMAKEMPEQWAEGRIESWG